MNQNRNAVIVEPPPPTPALPKVLIVTPLKDAGTLDAPHPFFRKTLEQVALLESSGYEFHFATMEGGICRALNEMVATAREEKFKWIVRWDYDIEPLNGVLDLLRLLGHRAPVVGSLYTRREPNSPYVANFMHEVQVQSDGLLQCIELGGGFMKAHIEVFENLERIFPNLSYTDRDTGKHRCAFFQQGAYPTDLKPDGDWMTEDFFFSWCCRMVKIPLWLDTQIRCRHRGKDEVRFPLNDAWPELPVDPVCESQP